MTQARAVHESDIIIARNLLILTVPQEAIVATLVYRGLGSLAAAQLIDKLRTEGTSGIQRKIPTVATTCSLPPHLRTNGQTPHAFPYRPRWGSIATLLAFFGSLAVLGAHTAIHNERGLIINHILHLGPRGATACYWAGVVIFSSFAMVGVVRLLRRLFLPQVLEITQDAVLLPLGLQNTHFQCISYSEIINVSERTNLLGTNLVLDTVNGTFEIAEAYLGRKGYKEVLQFLALQVAIQSRILAAHRRPSVQ